ncbi:TonB-dependent receptor [Lacibacter sp. H375]|uniref:SusC/RagA family TonB-linked outer membrane protein n=1 Tax=Lacibacter sp. H375 TaxID=3133424 RepID=UPI0030C51FEA
MKETNSLLPKKMIGLLIIFFTLFFSNSLYAQSAITGTVVDKAGKPVSAATVTVKGKSVATKTGDNGNFSVTASPDDVLIITSVGFATQEVSLNGKTSISIVMDAAASDLGEVVVIGYGTQRVKDLTGSVSAINITETRKYSTSDMSQLLQGRATGVQVNSDGQPGAAPSVRIRGFSTFGGSQPFYVVDGVPGASIRDFSPNDIESMTVLKDASAAAIYGAAAANGVIIITTKQGRKNSEMKITYNGYYGIDKVWQIQDVTNRAQYQLLNNESRINAGKPLFPANDPTNPLFVNNIDTDWQKEGLKTGNRQNHNVNMSGGGANSTYNISLDYFDNNGTYVGNGPDYKRYTARVNTSAEKGRFKIGQSLSYTHSKENTLTFRDDILLGGIPPLIGSLVIAIPTMPVYDSRNLNGFGGSNSEFNGANSLNGIGVNSVLENYVDVDRTFANVYGEYKILKSSGHNLKFKTSLNYDKTITRDYTWQPAFYFGNFFSRNIARLNDDSRVFTNASIENTLDYQKEFGKHNVEALLGQSYRYGSSVFRGSRAEGFTLPYYPVINNGQTRSSSGSEFENALSSYFGRINYSYDDKYLLSASLRRDGSSRFAPANKFGYFPAASVGWKISSEEFWKVPESIVSDLKLRASYGKLGNQQIADYQFQGTINTGVVYTFNGISYTGGLQTLVASPDIKWESKEIVNVGFDAKFLNGAIDFSAEYYNAKSTDILVGITIPASVGFSNLNPVVNAASLQNSGFEFSAVYHKRKGDFTFDISANFSTLKNKVLALGGNNEPLVGVGARTVIGGEVGAHYGFVYDGLFQTQAEINAHATQFGAVLKPGDVRYKDISGPDGKPDGVVNEAYDRVTLGSGIPKYNYGFSFSGAYKNFDLSVFASGSAKFLINSRMYRDLHHTAGAINYHVDMLNRWTPTNTNTDIPRLNDDDVNNGKDSNRPGWLQNGTYLRINTIAIGYTLPTIIKAVSNARIYATVQNLYSFQKYQGYNPDFTSGVLNPGFDFGSYPKPRTIMFGVQVTF